MTMKQTRVPVAAKTEKGDVIQGLYEVNLEVDWTSDNEPQARNLFLCAPRAIVSAAAASRSWR